MKKILALILIMIFIVTGCGKIAEEPITKSMEKKEENVTADGKTDEEKEEGNGEEIVTEEETIEEIPTESVPAEPTHETEKTTKKTETKKETQTTVPAVSEPVAIPEATGTTCAHQWGKEKFYYDVFKKMTFGCNGCGLALFEWADDKSSVEHIENLYVHEPCPTDRFEEPCCGGGYHSESVTIGFCALCTQSTDDLEGRVAYRQCMWTENGKRCSKNEVTGAYEKVEFDQNYFMYYDSCKCGKNMIIVNGNNDENSGRGIIYGTKEVCIFCGIDKNN